MRIVVQVGSITLDFRSLRYERKVVDWNKHKKKLSELNILKLFDVDESVSEGERKWLSRMPANLPIWIADYHETRKNPVSKAWVSSCNANIFEQMQLWQLAKIWLKRLEMKVQRTQMASVYLELRTILQHRTLSWWIAEKCTRPIAKTFFISFSLFDQTFFSYRSIFAVFRGQECVQCVHVKNLTLFAMN